MLNYFSQFGKVKKVEILKDKHTGMEFSDGDVDWFLGKSRCFGFVEFYDKKTMEYVLGRTHVIHQKKVKFRDFPFFF